MSFVTVFVLVIFSLSVNFFCIVVTVCCLFWNFPSVLLIFFLYNCHCLFWIFFVSVVKFRIIVTVSCLFGVFVVLLYFVSLSLFSFGISRQYC